MLTNLTLEAWRGKTILVAIPLLLKVICKVRLLTIYAEPPAVEVDK
jgi:hypothetical protein